MPTRRKIRKGTKSCWECKRKKARCIFSADDGDVCDGCKRRGLRCVAQDLPDPGASSHGGGSLTRIEAMLEQLLENATSSVSASALSGEAEQHDDAQPNRVDDVSEQSVQGDCISSISDRRESPIASPCDMSRSPVRRCSSSAQGAKSATPPCSAYDTDLNWIRRSFIKAWPTKRDLDVILDVPLQVEESCQGLALVLYTPESDTPHRRHQLSHEMLELPPAGSHPVLYARKLLTLASCLQSSDADPVARRGIDLQSIRHHAIETSCRLVTDRDELLSSIEGIECLAMEGMYHSYTGNLRRAWTTLRRAMTHAQAMGLHRRMAPRWYWHQRRP